jgi:acyl-CoA reductase-like NAD-dependent aldehyde dehydrogenase
MTALQQTISPIDNTLYVERPLATAEQIECALDAAVRAQRAWKTVPIAERAARCLAMVEAVVEKADELGVELTRQMGRPLRYTPNEIRRGFDERARYMVAIAEQSLADIRIEAKPGFIRFIRREPLGVVLTLAPWNYPYLTSVNSVMPAIMAGNTVILKHSNQTPLCAERFAEAFQAAGLPDGVFQYLHVDHGDVAKMIGDARIGSVAFTGSVEGGHAVVEAARRRFLGSQSCCGIERIYVHEAVFDRFVEGYVDLVQRYTLGNPLDAATTLGPMVRTGAAQFVRAQIAEAIGQGARALVDAARFPANREGTPYLAPQVLVDVDHSMRVMTEETFGPVVGIMPVSGDDEAVRLMNDSAYGLTAAIWTGDVDAAIAIGERIETGTWFMNRCDYLDPALAWTGVKDSGRGCTLSSVGYEYLTRPKSFHLRTATR